MIEAVLDFFKHGNLLAKVNAIVITLVPKVLNPKTTNELRPIACCNIIYKLITKMMCNRLKEILHDIIATNQAAFVIDRSTIYNVMIREDLVRLYNRNKV